MSADNEDIELCDKDYLGKSNYAEFVIGRLRSRGIWRTVQRIYRRIRKYTLVTAILRSAVFVVGLLEKSAILLLAVSGIIIALPFVLVAALSVVAVSAVGYIRFSKELRTWISESERVTVYITSERLRGRGEPLFVRMARAESEEYSHPVITVCGDRLGVARWLGFNLLAVRCDYFYILRRYMLRDKSVTYIVLS